MEIAPVNRSAQALPAAVAAVTSEKVAENREVIQAVKAVNGTQLLGQDNELMYQRDRTTGRIVIRLVNRQTGDVVVQVPPEYVLRMAEDAKSQQKRQGTT